MFKNLIWIHFRIFETKRIFDGLMNFSQIVLKIR